MEKSIIIVGEGTALHLKDKLVEHMKEKGYNFTDATDGDMTYIEVGSTVGHAISDKKYDLGVIVCGSGMGVNLAANRYPGVYCGLCESIHTARMARTITNCNVLAMGGNIVAYDLACKMLDAFVEAEFTEGFDDEMSEKLKAFFSDMEAVDKETHK